MDLVLSIYSVAKTLCEIIDIAHMSQADREITHGIPKYNIYANMLALRLAYNTVTISPLFSVPYLTEDFSHA
jgi:hypothetical protein